MSCMPATSTVVYPGWFQSNLVNPVTKVLAWLLGHAIENRLVRDDTLRLWRNDNGSI